MLGLRWKSGSWRTDGTPADATLFCACLVACLMATPIFWTHYLVLGYIVPLLLRPTRGVALGTVLGSWVLSQPVQAPSLLALSGDMRAVAFFSLLAAILAARVLPTRPPLLRRHGLRLQISDDACWPHVAESALVL